MTRPIVRTAALGAALALGCGSAPAESGADAGPLAPSLRVEPSPIVLRATDVSFEIQDGGKGPTVACMQGGWDVLTQKPFKGSDEELKAVLFGGPPADAGFHGADGPATQQISLNFEQIKLHAGTCDAPGVEILSAGAGRGVIVVEGGIQEEYEGARGLLIPTVY